MKYGKKGKMGKCKCEEMLDDSHSQNILLTKRCFSKFPFMDCIFCKFPFTKTFSKYWNKLHSIVGLKELIGLIDYLNDRQLFYESI